MSSSFASGAGFISRGTQTDLTAAAPPPVAVAQAANYESKSFSSMEQYRYVSNLHTTHMASYLTYIPHTWPVIWPTYHTYGQLSDLHTTHGQLSDLHTTHTASYLTYIPHIRPVIFLFFGSQIILVALCVFGSLYIDYMLINDKILNMYSIIFFIKLCTLYLDSIFLYIYDTHVLP